MWIKQTIYTATKEMLRCNNDAEKYITAQKHCRTLSLLFLCSGCTALYQSPTITAWISTKPPDFLSIDHLISWKPPSYAHWELEADYLETQNARSL